MHGHYYFKLYCVAGGLINAIRLPYLRLLLKCNIITVISHFMVNCCIEINT